jgi:biopolymer transport protein ExbB/TolQ
MNSIKARYRLLTRHRAWLPFAISGTVVLAAWLLVPSIYEPYVRVPSSKLEFALGCLPGSVEIQVRGPYAVTQQAQVSVYDPAAQRAARTIPFEVSKLSSEGSSEHIQLTFPGSELKATAEVATAIGGSATYVYTLLFARSPYIDVQKVHVVSTFASMPKCPKSDYKGDGLRQAIRSPSAKLMYLKLMQEELSDLVLAFNNSVANLCLAAMVVALLWFAYLLVSGAKRLYFSSDTSLRKDFKKFAENTPSELKGQGEEAVLQAQFQLQNRNLAFAKTMGPALGFLLTVSSLSAALHPSVQATQDTFRFVSGIQIAVIATFVGLAIRIVAQFAQRVHRDLAERLLLILRRESSTPEKTPNAI